VGLINGNLGEATVIALSDGKAELEVSLDKAPPPALPLTLLLALPRPKSLKKALLSLTSLGVKKIFIMRSYRVEKSYFQSPVLAQEALMHLCRLGLEQSCDTIVPEIHIRPLFKPFIEDEAPGLIRGTAAFVAHPHAADCCPCNASTPVTLAIGPEGGFIDYELILLQRHGFTPISLGPRILRVEDACVALTARLFGS